MIRYSSEEGFIKPYGIKDENNTREHRVKLPNIAIGVFSKELFESIIERFNSKKVGYISSPNFDRPVYAVNYKGKEITLFLAGISGPWISSDMEELSSDGVDTFIIFGNCGVLDSKIEDCSIIVPTKAFRDEGTSYHYIEDDETIDLSDEYKKEFLEILKEHSFDYTEGYTWTTDAFYRETKDKINYFKNNGAVCVEMEGSVIAAVSKRNNYHYFTFYYAGDNLDAVEWDERSLSEKVKLDKKKEVPILAFELALKIK